MHSTASSDQEECEDRIGTGPPRARKEVKYVDLRYWALSGSIHPEVGPRRGDDRNRCTHGECIETSIRATASLFPGTTGGGWSTHRGIQERRRRYRGTSLKRNSAPIGPYSRTMLRALWWSYGGGGCFLSAKYPCTSEAPQLTRGPVIGPPGETSRSHCFTRASLGGGVQF
jgi:hypothetical protein